ncbi:unnamed protein product [Prorocentrum cordatum]|uniref:Uncharacterized protein n=1 Tax=Prorocentrum cordatum TaxID=2364126 RepID=A0ABN9WC37_9DINO|nr:unnamed protein product [Polarella glacialis]
MRKLHPDRAGCSHAVEAAVESVRQAKELCERGLSREAPPGKPSQLRAHVIGTQPGKRKLRLNWSAPKSCSGGAVRKYVVAVHDPSYGRALSVAVLEPDYSQELKRYVSMEELNFYVFAEEDLQKMPKVWQQASAQVQVAAANDAGQSEWEVLHIPLKGLVPGATIQADTRPPRQADAGGPSDSRGLSDPCIFALHVRRHRGEKLHKWLGEQTKAALSAWLRSVSLPSGGTKDEMVVRAFRAIEKTTTR